jgi:DNA-binding LacI/PurR family transcriptional regulator/biotin operon repressor
MRKTSKPSSAKVDPLSLARLSRPLSLVAQVELALRKAIAEDKFPSGKLPTEVELAEQLGVSRETVRLAAEALQREGLLVKIRHRGTFTRFAGIPGQIRAVESKLLGYLQTDFVGAHGQEEVANRAISGLLLQGALAEAGTAGFQLVVRQTPHFQWRKAVQELCDSRRLRGLICTAYQEEKMLRLLAASGLPTVLLDEDSNVPRIHSVRDDCFEGARQAILYLAKLGHRRIAYAHWDRSDMNRWRLSGFRKGLKDAGLTHRAHREILTEMTIAGARQVVDRLLVLSPRPSALYCFNNTLASFAVAELRRRCVRVPEDMSVMGAGGEDIHGVTCHQTDWYGMGRTAVQIMLRALSAPDSPTTEHQLSPHTLQPGETTAIPGL